MKTLCLILSLLAAPGPASSAEGRLYVSPSGDDANPGTPSKPWRSLKKAAEVVRPGDTVIVRDGECRSQATRR